MIRIYGLMKFLLIKPALKNAHHADGRFTFVRKVKETLFNSSARHKLIVSVFPEVSGSFSISQATGNPKT